MIAPSSNSLSAALALSDSHIVTGQGSAVLDGAELGETDAHDLGSGLSVIAGQSAKAGDDPGGKGKGGLAMRIALSVGLALEPGRDGFEDGLIVRIEGIGQALVGGAIARLHELLDGDGGNGRGGNEVDHRLRLADARPLAVAARPLQRAEEHLDAPEQRSKD